MHFICEIIMPPTDDVETAVAEILHPFNENGHRNTHTFWDYWLIGGRWSGHKLETKLGADKIKAFYAELSERDVTVSGFRAGKETLQPESQIPMVDELWREHFPDSGIDTCPLFDHTPTEDIPGDTARLDEISKDLTCSRMIIAAPDYKGERLEAEFMIEKSIWNGVTHVDTAWDGNVLSGLVMWREKIKNYSDEYQQKNTPQPDWLVVTVDYHS